jgi:cytochrome P450
VLQPHDLQSLDVYGDDFQQRPVPWLTLLRASAPVHPLAEPGSFLVTTMALTQEVLSDPKTFSSAISRRTDPPEEVADEVATIRAQGYPYYPTLLLNDPPAHTRYRTMVQKAFRPRALAWMEPLVASVADELAAALPDGQTVDIIEVFTRPLPVWAISRVLGLPDTRRNDVRRWTDAATATIGAKLPPQRWPAVERDLLDYQLSMAAALKQRQQEPKDDLLSMLVLASAEEESDEFRIGIPELVSLTRELMVAGNESTLRLLADIVWRMDGRPEEWQRVREEPAHATKIVEEAVRLASPSAAVFRRVTRDTTLAGVRLPAGSQLIVSLLSANRDEQNFTDGDTFNPDRPAAERHISFGQGIHSCIGNLLARMEARHAIRALAENIDRLHVVGDEPPRYLPSLVVRGIAALPVRVSRRK